MCSLFFDSFFIYLILNFSLEEKRTPLPFFRPVFVFLSSWVHSTYLETWLSWIRLNFTAPLVQLQFPADSYANWKAHALMENVQLNTFQSSVSSRSFFVFLILFKKKKYERVKDLSVAALLLCMVDTMTLTVLLIFPLETETSGYLIKKKILQQTRHKIWFSSWFYYCYFVKYFFNDSFYLFKTSLQLSHTQHVLSYYRYYKGFYLFF